MENISILKDRLKNSQSFYLSKKGELDNINKEIKLKDDSIENLKKENETLTIEKKIIENACIEAREQSRQLLEDIASTAVSAVFQDDTKVKLVLDEKGDTPILDVKVTQKDEYGNEQEISPTFDGGGLNDVLSLCFLVAIGSTLENNKAPYILDEPSKYVSKGELAGNFADYMQDIASYNNKQIIMSTHDEAMLEINTTKYSIVKDPLTKVSQVTREN